MVKVSPGMTIILLLIKCTQGFSINICLVRRSVHWRC